VISAWWLLLILPIWFSVGFLAGACWAAVKIVKEIES
jgi:hypothetical protein